MITSETIELVANACWAQREFTTVNFGDERLKKRIIKIATDFAKQPAASIPKAVGSWAATKATYNFFNHNKVNNNMLLSSHVKSTINRMSSQPVVLCVQDTTALNFTTHAETQGLGTLSSQQDKTLGIMLHDTMAFTPEGIALGLIDLQTWTRPKQDYGKRVNRKHKPIQEKESNKWLTSYQKTEQSQRQLPNTLLVNISDRESDIYEYFELATRTDDAAKVLVRASHNRLVDHPEKYLWNFMDKQTISGTLTIEVPRQNKKPKRQANLAIRFAQVTIKKAKNITASNIPDSISAWAILAQEINPPHQVEAVSWLLLTTVPIHSFDETVEKVQWYTIRWQIEIFHKVLKSGCKTEKRQLQTVEKLVKCLFVDAIIAWRILLLTKLGREVPNLPCSVIFEDYEWKALNGYIHHTTELIDKEPTLQQAIRMVAKLGGFLERNGDGEPGVMTIWRGMMRLNDIAESYLIFFSPSNSLPRTYG